MIRGRLALGGLSLEFGNARGRFDELATRVRELAREHGALLGEETALLDELARLYLPDLSPEAVAGGLAELRAEMQRALVLQAGHRAELGRDLEKAEASLEARTAELERRVLEEEEQAKLLQERRDDLESALAGDPEHQRATEEHRALMARLEVLKRRRVGLASLAHAERRRYRAYPPFDYLQRRGWGSPGYRANPLTRRLDRWLARSIGYEALARSWIILEQGPRVIGVEIDQLKERAAELERWIDDREREEGERRGLLAALDAAATAEKRHAEARDQVARARAHRDRLVGELQAVEAKRGAAYEAVIDRHEELLRSETFEALMARARATADPSDDELVGRLEGLRARVEASERELHAARRELDRLAKVTGQLAQVEQGTMRFSEPRSRFPDGFDLGEVIAPLLAGETHVRHVLETIRRAHSKEPLLQSNLEGLQGWFGELSSAFDGTFEMHVEELDEADFVVFDAEGNVIERRVTRRGKPGA